LKRRHVSVRLHDVISQKTCFHCHSGKNSGSHVLCFLTTWFFKNIDSNLQAQYPVQRTTHFRLAAILYSHICNYLPRPGAISLPQTVVALYHSDEEFTQYGHPNSSLHEKKNAYFSGNQDSIERKMLVSARKT
jgi:hypothetical protein